MKFRVMYHSRGGNTKKVGEAIAKSIGAVSEAIPPAYPCDSVNLLFLGTGLYMNKIDEKMKDYINTLTPNRVKNVALFGTTGSQDTAITMMKDQLKKQGINVVDESFVCKGKAFLFFNRKHPSSDDLKNAADYAKRVKEKLGY